MSRFVIVLVGCLLALATMVRASDQGLFINLTSDEINRAAMAIFLADRSLEEKGASVAIFLNVEGIRLADKHLPRHRHAKGKTTTEMLHEFMNKGGQVFACPMCMANVGGMSPDDLIEGVKVADMDGVWEALFGKDVRVLSY